jgi:membrane associated rhomboid family serine protease
MGFNPALARSICRYGMIPGELLGQLNEGARVPLGQGLACMLDGTPNWSSVVTSMFMHGGWFHIIGNMWFLAVFGDNVEEAMGSIRFIAFYLLCGIAAAVAQTASAPSSAIPMVGASGAIGGVMGAYAMLYPRAPVHLLVFFGFFFTRIVVPAFVVLGYWFVLQVLGGLPALEGTRGGVAFWAHVGGFVAGVVLVRMFCRSDRVAGCRRRRGRADSFARRIR